ncbi:MAG: Gfo/Idh/MocA family protein [Rariglobus sp.]
MPTPNGCSLPRLALIGVSGYGGIYLKLLREALRRKTVRLVAAVIINPQDVPEIVAELKAGGTAIYADANTFFTQEAGRIDLCLIPVGIQWHARLTIAALQSGMNVLVEKPLAGSVADTAAIRRAEKESGRWVAVGFQDLYSLESHWLKTQLIAGVIGKLESIRMIGQWPRPRSYFARNHWAGRIQADGAAVLDSPLNNAFAHFVNLAMYFAGDSVNESADIRLKSVELYRAHHIETFDTAIVSGATDGGTAVWFGVSHASGITREPEIYLQGSAGRAEWWHEQRCVVVDSAGRRQVFPLPSTDDSRQLMFAAVVARLTDPAAFVCTTEIAEKHTRLIETIHQSGPVREFPASSIDWVLDPHTKSEIPLVNDLSEELNAALLRGGSLAKSVSSLSPFLIRSS